MVYTKHKVIHSFNQLQIADDYIKNTEKTVSPMNLQLDNSLDYIVQDFKTGNQQFISGHLLGDVTNAYKEFIATKNVAELSNSRHLKIDERGNIVPPDLLDFEKGNKNGKTVVAHHLIQSFDPNDNLTPEQVHEIGRQTVLELTGEYHQFVIATHLDKGYLHNHIIFNSTDSLTGKAFRWQKGTKKKFEDISDKIASRFGAKIIEKTPGKSHAQYTQWQANKIFKKKIKSRLDFLLANSNSKEDFLEKAKALSLKVDFKGKHTKFKLTDEEQEQWTRARTLDKKDPDHYQIENIQKLVDENDVNVSVKDVVDEYMENVENNPNDYTWQVEIDPWQIDSTNSQGIYLNVDFGSDKQGQVFIHGNYLDPKEDGGYLLFLKEDNFFSLTSADFNEPDFVGEKPKKQPRYIKGSTLVKQLSQYNGKRPVRSEPVMKSIDDYLQALNFYAKKGNGTLTSGQGRQIEQNLLNEMKEAKERLKELDLKIIELKTEIKNHMDSPSQVMGIKNELNAYLLSRENLHDSYEAAVKDLDFYRGMEARSSQETEEEKKQEKKGPTL